MKRLTLLLILFLMFGGCEPLTDVANHQYENRIVYTFQNPLCLFICTPRIDFVGETKAEGLGSYTGPTTSETTTTTLGKN